MNKSRTSRLARIAASAVTIAATIALVSLPAGAANADPSPPPPSVTTTTTTTVPLTFDCSSITAQGRTYIAAHNLGICGIYGTSGSTVHTNAVIPCGYASVRDTYWASGETLVSWSLTSTVGEMVSRVLYITWNGSNGAQGGFPDIGFMAQSSYKNSAVVRSGFSASAAVSGSVHIWYGLDCVVALHT